MPSATEGRKAGPRGWARLAALGPLHGALTGQECTAVPGCTALAIVGTPDGFRCAAHPPTDGPPGRRGWGYALDWTPHGRNQRDRLTVCAQAAIRHEPVPAPRSFCRDPRCYCGRCGFYTTSDPWAGVGGGVDLNKRRKVGGVAAGRQGRDRGQAAAAAGSPLWSERAAAALADLARLRVEFTADDLIARVGLPHTSETNANNAVGAAFSAASRAGIIGRTGKQVQSGRPEANARWLAVWEGTGAL